VEGRDMKQNYKLYSATITDLQTAVYGNIKNIVITIRNKNDT